MIGWIRRWSATLACALYWGIGGPAFVLLSLVAVPLLPCQASQRLGRRLLRSVFYGFTRLLALFRIAKCQMVGFDKLRGRGGVIIAPNHPAIWDAVFILAHLPGLACILKASLLRNPLTAGGARMSRFIPNEPPQEMIKSCSKALSEGESLLLIPEGTRTRKKETVINEFRGGIAIMARHSRAPVYPVIVETDGDYGCKGWPLWLPPRHTVHIRMTVGEPIICGEDEKAHAFLERLRARYIEALSGVSTTP